MPPNHLLPSTISHIRQTMDLTTSDPQKLPGCVAVIIDKTGATLFSHASGTLGAPDPTSTPAAPMTLDTVFWIASCTKMVAGIAAMQLVERGLVGLDDVECVERWCPELKRVRILRRVKGEGEGEGVGGKGGGKGVGERLETVEKKGGITLRMLLSHTAGFGYTFFHDILRLNSLPIGMDELDAHHSAVFEQPLMFEPGTDWAYGVGIDWAGTLIERVTSMSLNTYFQTHIFAPLNLHQISMFPAPQMLRNLAHMNQKYPSLPIRTRDHPYRRPLRASPSEVPDIYNSAGAGLFACPTSYTPILGTLLNDGVSPTTGARILSKASIDEMFTNQIPQFPDFGRKGIKSAKVEYTNDIPDLYPQPKEQAQGWGLTFMLTLSEGATGRGKNTAWWAGLPNLFWWCDREKGVAGMVASQILPFNDPEVIGLWVKIEKAVYDGLAAAEKEGENEGSQQDNPRDGPLDDYHHEFVANLER